MNNYDLIMSQVVADEARHDIRKSTRSSVYRNYKLWEIAEDNFENNLEEYLYQKKKRKKSRSLLGRYLTKLKIN